MTSHPDALLAADGQPADVATADAGQTGIEPQDANPSERGDLPVTGKSRQGGPGKPRKKKRGPRCCACGRHIDPATGYAYVSLKAAALRELHYRDWLTQRYRGIVTGPPPKRIPWWFAHDRCADPDPARIFALRLSAVSTDRKLLETAIAISFHRTIAANSEWQQMVRAVLDARRGHG
jgi:hypothetical protein